MVESDERSKAGMDEEITEPSPEEGPLDGDVLEEAAAESEALIEQFLAETGGAVVREPDEAVGEGWGEASLPEDHKSGFVALVGRPNVGKSTLVNALVGHKVAIVSPKPQTTRSRITGILTEPDHQIIFVDTPGIHERPAHRLNELMIEEAVAAIPDADLILFVVDVSARPRDEDRLIARLLREKAQESPVILTLNKMDQLSLAQAEERIKAYWDVFPDYVDSMPVSALKGTNVDRLRDHILDYMPCLLYTSDAADE